jgi:diguanylate cyclase (GGDEF)-like protein
MRYGRERDVETVPGQRVAANLAPFGAAAALAAIVASVATTVDWTLYAAALCLGLLAGLIQLTRWHGTIGKTKEVLPSLVFLAAVAALRSSTGGANSGVAVVSLLPVFWTALYGNRRQLCVVTLGVAAFFFAPLLLVGSPAYPSSQYRAGVLFLAVSAIIGFTTQRLVAQVRSQADQAEHREHALEKVAEMMRKLSSTDELTGLPNRRAWEAKLSQALLDDERFVLAMLDLDHFKDYNDTHGHPAGDRLLKETAAAWRDELRIGDFLARIGGEEFALLLPTCATEDALMIVERLRRRVPYEQTCSAGIVVGEPDESSETLMDRVDEALYSAKASGRDCSSLSGSSC